MANPDEDGNGPSRKDQPEQGQADGNRGKRSYSLPAQGSSRKFHDHPEAAQPSDKEPMDPEEQSASGQHTSSVFSDTFSFRPQRNAFNNSPSTTNPLYSATSPDTWSGSFFVPRSDPGYMPEWLKKHQEDAKRSASGQADECETSPDSFVHGKQRTHFRRLSRAAKEKAVLEYLESCYVKCRNALGAAMLMDKRTGQLFPLSASEIRKQVKAFFLHQYSTSISGGVLDSALDIFTELTSTESFVSPVFGRAGFNSETRERYISFNNDFLYFPPSQPGYRIVNFLPHIVPLYSEPLPRFLVEYQAHSDIADLYRFINYSRLPQESDLLLIAWMILVWMPEKKQVMLELLGPPSEAQIMAQRSLKKLLDPSRNSHAQSPPTSKVKFEEYAQRDFLLSFERLDGLTLQQQRLFLAILQGQYLRWNWPGAKRSDIEIHVQCPLLISSVESLVTHSPLADRTVSLDITHTADAMMPIWPSMGTTGEEVKPLMALLKVFGFVHMHLIPYRFQTGGYREGPLADLCVIGELVAVYLGRSTQEFWEQLENSRNVHQEYALQENEVARAIEACLKANSDEAIEETVHDWLELLKEYQPEEDVGDQWPKTSRALAARFKLAMGLLERHGIRLMPLGKKGSYRYWRAEKIATSDANPSLEAFELPWKRTPTTGL